MVNGAEKAVLEAVDSLIDNETVKDAIEEGAFNSGYSVGSVLFVGGLYIRDRVLEHLEFNVKEIDKHDPENPANKKKGNGKKKGKRSK